jgi:hypothetical protein
MNNSKLSINALHQSVTKVEVIRVLVSQHSKPSVSVSEFDSAQKFLEAASRLVRYTDSNIWAVDVLVTRKADGGWMVRESIDSVLFVKLLSWEMMSNTLASLTKVFHRHDDGIESCRRDWEGNLKNVLSLEEQERNIRIAFDMAKHEWNTSDAIAAEVQSQSSTVADAFDALDNNEQK